MAIVFVKTSGVRATRDYLAGAAQRLRNTSAVRKNLGEEMLVRNQRRMRAGVDINNKPYKASGRAKKFGGQTLFNTGQIAASVNYDTPGQDLALFSTDKRARVHWEGLEIKPKPGKKFLTIPLRGRGGLFDSIAGANAPNANRTGARAGHYAKGTTFFLWRGGKLFLMQRVQKGLSDNRVTYRGVRRRKGASPGSVATGYALRALFLLVRSVKMPKREFFGFGSADLAMAAEKLGGHVVGEEKK